MSTGRPLRAIIVDDEKLIRDIIKPALTTLGCDIVGEAESGPDGIRLFEETSPDLVLLDIRMPDMDGVEVLAALKERTPEAYVVMLTAVDDTEVIEDCMIARAKDYLRKTIPVQDMISRLQRHIDRLGGPA
ncbi:MAG: response regulator [Magnetovibrio sp.]|nr:response regulator [Magnetovibrio sp.]